MEGTKTHFALSPRVGSFIGSVNFTCTGLWRAEGRGVQACWWGR